jgi:3-oxoacyl-[acyl-carrier protein] reductase
VDLGLQGRVALVTASSKGLGRASAQALSEEGAKLVLCARDRQALEEAAAAMPGGPPPARALEVTDDAVLAAIDANLLRSIRLVRAAVPHMRAAGWGRICLIASISVKQPIPTLALSNTARTGLWAWAKTAAADLADDGITLNLACPGTHATERMRQLGGLGDGWVGDPADFGKVVCFLCSDQARFVSGAALQVDGAATLGLL